MFRLSDEWIDGFKEETQTLQENMKKGFLFSIQLGKCKARYRNTRFPQLKEVYSKLIDWHGNEAQKCLLRWEYIPLLIKEALL